MTFKTAIVHPYRRLVCLLINQFDSYNFSRTSPHVMKALYPFQRAFVLCAFCYAQLSVNVSHPALRDALIALKLHDSLTTYFIYISVLYDHLLRSIIPSSFHI